MTRLALLALALALPACADYTPDSDVQLSCEGEHAAELCAHAANAAVALNPHLPFWFEVRDPEVTGVTWRDAVQWRLLAVPDGTTVTASGGSSTLGCDGAGRAVGTTDYESQTVYISECATDYTSRYNLGEIVWHELGHAVGARQHVNDSGALMRPKARRYKSARDASRVNASYTTTDIRAIEAQTAANSRPDNIIEALSH